MTEFDPYIHIVRPVMTERSTDLREKYNQYVFEVARASSKTDIRRAVQDLFKVKVERVRTMGVHQFTVSHANLEDVYLALTGEKEALHGDAS